MVLISVGTQKQQFTRALDLIANSKVLRKEEIIAQNGHTVYESKKIKCVGFIPFDEMEEYIEKADLVVAHGGVGTIFAALKHKKKVLAIPRLEKYGEHINDHQLEICAELEKEGYILFYKDGQDNIDDLIKKVRNTEFREYVSNENYLDTLRKEI